MGLHASEEKKLGNKSQHDLTTILRFVFPLTPLTTALLFLSSRLSDVYDACQWGSAGGGGEGGGDLAAGRGICNCMVWPSGKLSLICQLTSEDIKQHFT